MKIIEIMSHPPPYEIYKNNRPKINWDTSSGTWVGIWGYDVSDLTGMEIMNYDREIVYEVWQPDLRADKIYSHTFENGMVHKNFPAIMKVGFEGLKSNRWIYSDSIINELNQLVDKKDIVLVLDGAPLMFNMNLHNNFYKKFPIMNSLSGDPKIFFNNLESGKIVKRLHRQLIHKQRVNYFNKINNLLMADIPDSINFVKEKFNCKIYTNVVGLDFNEWKIDKSKYEARNELNIPSDSFIIFSSSRLNSLKQVDKLIIILSQLNEFNFKCYVSGHGSLHYEQYLKNLIIEKNLSDKVYMVGYISEEELHNYYLASDLFVTLSRGEGGPVSAWKAMALEIPVFTTDTGNVIKVLKNNNAGQIVTIDDYNQWKTCLKEILEGKKINIMKRFEVEKIASWPNVSKKFIESYKEIFDNFYRRDTK